MNLKLEEEGFLKFFSEEIDFKLQNENTLTQWILSVIIQEKKSLGEINVIFCQDDYLLKMNVKFLNHNTLTDVISFNYVVENKISGDIFISIDRVKENASKFNSPFTKELHRVIIHGILHLLEYDDKTPKQSQEIRAKEDFYLALLAQ